MFFTVNHINVTKTNVGIVIENSLNHAKIELSDDVYIDEFYLLQKKGTKKLDSELKKVLYEQEFLIDENKNKEYKSNLEAKMNEILYLTILPTMQCNFRCVYCYEKFNNKVMDEFQIESIKKFVKKLLETYDFKQLSLFWFGGEPTLCKKQVINATLDFKYLAEEFHIGFHAGMTTNGFLFDKDTFCEYLDSGIKRFQITIDSFQHDKTRKLVNGKGTLSSILQNIKEISALPVTYDYRITIRNNILADQKEYHWYAYIADLINGDRRFSILLKRVLRMGGEHDSDLNIIDNEKDTNFQNHLNAARETELNVINDNRVPLCDVCYASYPFSYTFRPDGIINKCTVALYDSYNEIGFIDENTGEVYIDDNKNMAWIHPQYIEKCTKCSDLSMCMNKKCPKVFFKYQDRKYVCL